MHRNGFPVADLMKASLQATPKAATDYAAARTPHNHSIRLTSPIESPRAGTPAAFRRSFFRSDTKFGKSELASLIADHESRECQMNDPKKPTANEAGDEPEEVLDEPWDHPDQDPDRKPDLDDLRKSVE